MIQQVIFAQPDCVKSSTSLWVSSKVLDTSDWKDALICSFNNEAMWFSLESFLWVQRMNGLNLSPICRLYE
jgi:hypothetical protein